MRSKGRRSADMRRKYRIFYAKGTAALCGSRLTGYSQMKEDVIK